MQSTPKQKLITYWLTESRRTLRLANDVLKKRYYDHALFCGHLALEKLLKAIVVTKTNGPAPRSHDLLYLARLAAIELSIVQQKMLVEITTFNIAGRYHEEKLAFHQRITKTVAVKWIAHITQLYLWLEQQYKKN